MTDPDPDWWVKKCESGSEERDRERERVFVCKTRKMDRNDCA